jgi:hypothetical protein
MDITHFRTHDDYMTPKSAWEAIRHLIPKDKVIWEPFYGDGKSGEYLKELGFDVIHEPIDFFIEDRGDIIVSNPPYSRELMPKIVKRLKQLNKPWILLMPVQKLSTNYFREAFMDDKLQLVIPYERVQFKKMVDGEVVSTKSKCPFDCYYYFYDCGLPHNATLLTAGP